MVDATAGQGVGPAGTTHTVETAIYCGGCGAFFGARLLGGIDAATDAALLRRLVEGGIAALNQAECGACGWRTAPAEPVLVHRPGEALFLILPTHQRHRVRQAQAEALRRVVPEPGQTLPAYSLSLRILAEDDLHLAATLLPDGRRVAAVSEVWLVKDLPASEPRLPDLPFAPPAWEPGRRPLDRPTLLDDPLASRDISLDEVMASLDEQHEEVLAPVEPHSVAPQAVAPMVPDTVHDDPLASRDVSMDVLSEEHIEASTPPVVAAPEPDERSGEVVLAEILGARPAAPPSRAGGPPRAGEAGAEDWEALDQAWSLDAVQPRQDDDPTHVVHADELEAPPKRAEALRPTGPAFDSARAGGQSTYLQVGERGVEAVVRMDADRARRFLEEEAELRFQLHQTPQGLAAGLLLLHLDAGGTVDDQVFWVIDEDTAEGEEILERLETAFALDVRLHASQGEHLGRRHFEAHLESNVGTIRIVLLGADGDRVAARRAVQAADFDRLGRLRHGFHQESFADVKSAAEARLALGILGYWSTPERRDYLLRVKSFPEPWFEAMTRRVLQAALEYGIAMEAHLRQRALELKLAPNSASLLRRSLANFAEVNLNLKPGGLDALDTWDNWEALLAHAEELDLRVDEEIEELAARAMERARHAAQAAEPAEIHLADESIELEEVMDLGDLAEDELVDLLGRPAHRLDAALALLHKGDALFVPALFDAIKTMSRDELLHAVPAALALGPAFEAHFLGGLRARRTSLRLASALFLSEIRSERATGPLLALMSVVAETEWAVLSRAAARMGRRIIGPALSQVAAEGDPGDRIAHTLALLGGEGRGALAAAREQRSEARVRNCLTIAIERMHEVSFGDAADFTERLADAFAAAGPDLVGPDFEEVLDSVDLGPGASMSDLETDVNLDGLDD